MEKAKRLKKINTLISGLSMLGFLAFLLHHYQYINIGVFDHTSKGYFILALLSLLGLFIGDILEIKIIKAQGEKVKILSVIIDIILFVLLAAFVWYIYTLPLGVCPIRSLFKIGEEYKEIKFQ